MVIVIGGCTLPGVWLVNRMFGGSKEALLYSAALHLRVRGLSMARPLSSFCYLGDTSDRWGCRSTRKVNHWAKVVSLPNEEMMWSRWSEYRTLYGVNSVTAHACK